MEAFTTPYALLNGEIINGRSKRNQDGSYHAYDLQEAISGDTLVIQTNEGMHVFVKDEADAHEDKRANWSRVTAEKNMGGAIRFALLESNKHGASPFLPGIVMQRNMELGVVEGQSEVGGDRVLKSLGVIASIVHYETIQTGGRDGSYGVAAEFSNL